jgi:chemotaxis protein methyltransferase CheR
MDSRDFTRLLDRFALSAEGYRKVRKGMQKRIVRHMQELRCPSMKAYLEQLDIDGNAEHEARRLMDVSISRFFRDGPLWRTLEEEILPSLIEQHPGGLRVWSAGCALGQEVYSFAILWAMLTEAMAVIHTLELWATDVNPAYLERAIEGVYPAGALARVPAEARARFFKPAGKKTFRVVDEVRQGIRWKLHDLTADAMPERDFHIVFLRNNLLTYYRKEILEGALPKIADCVVPGGYLVIGRKEHLTGVLKGLDPHPAVSCLYCKQGSRISSSYHEFMYSGV